MSAIFVTGLLHGPHTTGQDSPAGNSNGIGLYSFQQPGVSHVAYMVLPHVSWIACHVPTALLAEAEVKFHTRNENESLVTPITTAFNLPWEVIAETEGGSVNRPAGKLTVIVCDPPSGSTFGNATPPPVATRGTPDTEPSLLNVNGPQRPLPSHLTSNVDDADTKVDGSALGKSLESPGAEPDCQSVDKVEMNAVDSPAYTLKFGVRKSVRVGVVVFFARDGVINPTPAG